MKAVIGLITAGCIIIIIPMLFFSVGKIVEIRAMKREITRYFAYWCTTIMDDVLPQTLILRLKTNIDKMATDPKIKANDAVIVATNKKLMVNTYIICLVTMFTLIVIAHIIAIRNGYNLIYIWSEAFLGTLLFVLIEVILILSLFNIYYPLDINFVNRYILSKLQPHRDETDKSGQHQTWSTTRDFTLSESIKNTISDVILKRLWTSPENYVDSLQTS